MILIIISMAQRRGQSHSLWSSNLLQSAASQLKHLNSALLTLAWDDSLTDEIPHQKNSYFVKTAIVRAKYYHLFSSSACHAVKGKQTMNHSHKRKKQNDTRETKWGHKKKILKWVNHLKDIRIFVWYSTLCIHLIYTTRADCRFCKMSLLLTDWWVAKLGWKKYDWDTLQKPN